MEPEKGTEDLCELQASVSHSALEGGQTAREWDCLWPQRQTESTFGGWEGQNEGQSQGTKEKHSGWKTLGSSCGYQKTRIMPGIIGTMTKKPKDPIDEILIEKL